MNPSPHSQVLPITPIVLEGYANKTSSCILAVNIQIVGYFSICLFK